MKIGVSSYSFSHYMKQTGADYLKICDIAKEMGYEGIEFIDIKADDVPAMARAIREHCEKLGLDITAYTVGANLLAEDVGAEVERLKGCVDIAAILGAPVMRHDACWAFQQREHARTYRDAIDYIADPIREITEYAQTKGVRTCTENHGTFMQDSYRVEELMMAVGHPNYGWLVDMGNFACADEDSVHAVAVAAPYAFHVHAKDFLWKSGKEQDPGEGWFRTRGGNYLRGTVVGHGVIPVAQCVHMLKSSGYDGYVSIEFEGLEENLDALRIGLANLRKIVG